MKVLIICYSKHHGNTLKIAEAIADIMGAKIVSPEQTPENFDSYDLIGFGSGIYFFKHHKKMFEFVKNIPQQDKKKAFVFSTSGDGRPKFHVALKKALENKGFEVTKEFSCKGYDTWGPLKIFGGINKGRPHEEDLKAAREFAKEIGTVAS